MSKSIKKNFLYSSILTTANYIFPFLTYPYVSRVLGVTNIGICNFIDGIISYFILFSMMGISTIGVREVAKAKGNKEELCKVFSSIFLLNTILTTAVLVTYLVAIPLIPQLHQYQELAYIGVIKLIGNYLLVEWLFIGLEDFKYITKRSIIVKVLYVASIFIFVRKADDYPIYFLLIVLMVGVNSIFNLCYARRFINFTVKGLNFKPYFKPVMILGCYMLLTSMYTSFNTAYLGIATNPTQVGYYTTATKIYTILLALFTAFTNVMMPRMSSLLSEGKMDEFKRMVHKSIDILIAFSFPLIVMSVVFAPQIIRILSGAGYEGAITPMRIVMPLMLVIGYAQIVVIQILIPLNKDKAILINSILGAASGLALNFLLVPHWGAVGSAWVWIISELFVTVSAQYFVTKDLGEQFPYKKFVNGILCHLPLTALAVLIYILDISVWVQAVLAGLVTLVYCYILQYVLLKNTMVVSMVDKIRNMIPLKRSRE